MLWFAAVFLIALAIVLTASSPLVHRRLARWMRNRQRADKGPW